MTDDLLIKAIPTCAHCTKHIAPLKRSVTGWVHVETGDVVCTPKNGSKFAEPSGTNVVVWCPNCGHGIGLVDIASHSAKDQ